VPLQPDAVPEPWREWWQSFVRSLRASNRAEPTIEAYSQGVRQLATYLKAQGRLAAPTEVTRGDVQGFLGDLLSRHRPATALTRYKAIRAFYGWLEAEGELERSPMLGVKPPQVPENPPPVLSERDVTKLLAVCQGRSFMDRRDAAIIRFLIDTGCRRGEVAGLLVADINLDDGTALVHGKGSRDRIVAFGRRTARDLDRYLRVRAADPRHTSPALWMGLRGPLSGPGILAVVKARAVQAGLDGRMFAHLFRHSFANAWLSSGGSEGALMQLGGWRSRAVMDRYGASAASERAREAHRVLSPGDRV
jgi:site-specific recombinase XerD